MMQKEIQKIIEQVIKKLGNFGLLEILVEAPKDKTHGDYFTNVAFSLAAITKKTPNEMALILKNELVKNSFFKDVVVVGGFINFFIKDELFHKTLKQILKEKGNFGKNSSLKNKKIIIEYTDPNPFPGRGYAP